VFIYALAFADTLLIGRTSRLEGWPGWVYLCDGLPVCRQQTPHTKRAWRWFLTVCFPVHVSVWRVFVAVHLCDDKHEHRVVGHAWSDTSWWSWRRPG